ncbi:MAG: hypothetical protein K8S98_11340 [Planctomycetes bacterium]|nr:hypothetical protein [Planctomycetota bacterium]
MAFLIRRSNGRLVARLALGATLVALAGCVWFDGLHSTRREYAFSHRAHVEQELACTDCHLGAEETDEPGMPGLAQCRLCHADLDAEKPAERKVDSLYDGKLFKRTARGALSDEIVFSHQRHVGAGLDCTACHGELATSEDVIELPVASMASCVACHASRGRTDDCATCHNTIRADAQPPSHDGLWTKRHGSVARAESSETANRCDLCHQVSSCTQCHQTTPPQNHTNQWRGVGHGLVAGLDRENCTTCHQPATCRSCHAESLPRNHTGSFGSPRDTHCLTCHEPLQGEGCATCHAAAPSHALALPKPSDHTPAMNCRQCHLPGGVLPPMPHPDDGSNCNRCHA